MKALLLSAGLGTRFRPYTEKIPKPAIPLLNLPLGLHPLLYFQKVVSRLVVNLHYLPGRVQQVFRDSPYNYPVDFSFETEKPLGSGGAIQHARNKLVGDGSFWYINGDEVILGLSPEKLQEMLDLHRHQDALVSIMVTSHQEAGINFGAICCDSTWNVTNICRKAEPKDNPFHFVGIMLIKDELAESIPPGDSNIFYDIVLPKIKAGEKVLAYHTDVNWYEMGNIDNYLEATQSILNILDSSEHSTWQTLFRQATTHSGLIKTENSKIWAHESATIDDPKLITGFAVLGKDSRISVPVNNVVVAPGVHVSQTTSNDLCL